MTQTSVNLAELCDISNRIEEVRETPISYPSRPNSALDLVIGQSGTMTGSLHLTTTESLRLMTENQTEMRENLGIVIANQSELMENRSVVMQSISNLDCSTVSTFTVRHADPGSGFAGVSFYQTSVHVPRPP